MAVHVDYLCVTFLCLLVLSQECSKGYPFEHYLGTRTPYRSVSNNSLDKVHYEGCSPKKIWMIVRHGTRNPSTSHIESINRRLPQIKELILNSEVLPNGKTDSISLKIEKQHQTFIDFIRNRDLDLLRSWKPTLDLDDENKLTHEGEEEMLLLAERMQSRFPEVLDNAYSNTTYKFKYTFSQRTKKSAYYFASGLFGKNTAKDVWFPEPSKRDPILRFYKLCHKWKKEIKTQVREQGEHKKFQESPEMVKVVQEVNEKLGLKNDLLTVDDIVLMYVACGFETAWNKRSKSPWCSPISENNFKILEYMEDLKYYWQDGYGYDLSYKQACPAFGDMINHFESTNQYPKATIYFTHSGTLLKMLAHLGLYKDADTLTASKYREMTNRKWKTSLIDSFATNLAFVLYDCDGTEKVLTLHQENIVKLPSCPDSDLCDLRNINNYYSQSIDSCDFNVMCNVSENSDH